MIAATGTPATSTTSAQPQTDARSLAPDHLRRLEGVGARFAAALPPLLVQAQRIANTFAHGTHGRRRAGPGETFWQFRAYERGDSAAAIDWRRSASSDRLYVREREWEAAQTVQLWCDLSGSMDYRSDLAAVTKRERGLVLNLALADILARSGERIGQLGVMPPRLNRNAPGKIVTALHSAGVALDTGRKTRAFDSLPPDEALPGRSLAVLISDFLEPMDVITARVRKLAASGATGHLVHILDPIEETFPFSGRTEFVGFEDAGRHLTDEAGGLRGAYHARLKERKTALRRLADQLRWSYLVHHTDKPAQGALLAVHTRLSGGR
ncbi:MAG: DUF58 domain-containing protein [Pseudomonadota bacterium]